MSSASGELVECPTCRARLSLPAGSQGKSVRCPSCSKVFAVPAPAVQPAAPAFAGSNSPYASPEPALSYNPSLGQPNAGARPEPEATPSLVLLMTIPLYISSAIYCAIAAFIIAFGLYFATAAEAGPNEAVGLGIVFIAIAGFSALWGVFAGIVAYKISRRKKWAWIAGIVLGALYTPSAFIILGVPILIGAFHPDVKTWIDA